MSMISDFHSHILPGIDDGSASPAESAALLRLEAEQGVKLVAATPHFYAHRDRIEDFLARRAKASERLQPVLAEDAALPEIRLGAEVYYFRGISQTDALRQLTLEGTDCVLIEMPLAPWTDSMYRELAQIPDNLGLTPIIAHVDRYIAPFAAHGIPQRLARLPVLVQANAAFFLRRSTAAMALRMLRREQIHLLGSDCHNLTSRRPNLGDAAAVIERRLGSSALDWIRENQREILGP